MKNIKGEKIYNLSGIYCIKNTITNKKYVGSSKNIYYRTKQHLSHLRKNKHCSKYFQNSFNKYGEDVFITEILEICTNNVKILREKEKYWIDTLLPEYNVMQNPITWEPNEKTKKQISETLKRKYASKEILPNYNLDKAISIQVFSFKEELIGVFRSIRQLQENFKPLQNASLKNNLRKGIYICNNYITIPTSKSFDFCIQESIKNCCKIPILKVLNNEVSLCLQSEYPHSVFEKVNKNKGKITKIRKRKEIFLHLGFLKKLMPSLNSVNCGKPLENIELQNS